MWGGKHHIYRRDRPSQTFVPGWNGKRWRVCACLRYMMPKNTGQEKIGMMNALALES